MKKIVLIFILSLCSVVHSEERVSTEYGHITRLHFYWGINGVLIRHVDGGIAAGCPRGDQYVLSKNHPFYDEVYALLLGAYMAKKNVGLTLHSHECPGGYASIKHVTVVD